MNWQKWARLLIAAGGVAFAVVVVLGFRKGTTARQGGVSQTDPKALIDMTEGFFDRTNRSNEVFRFEYRRLRGFDDGSSKLDDVIVTTTRASGRTFKITAKEATVSGGETEFEMTGNVRIQVSDGMLIHTEHATYTDKDGLLHAPGPVDISRAPRMTGSSIGLTYNKALDVVTLLDHVKLHMAPDERGNNAMEIASPIAEFNRVEKTVKFDSGLKSSRGRQVIEADHALARLSDDENQLNGMDLHGNARVRGTEGGVGGLRGLSGRDILVTYGPDGQSIQHAVVSGDASIQLAGGPQSRSGRQISANVVELSFAADGVTPTSITATDGVQLVFPPEPGTAGRVINADHMTGRGDESRGLTSVRFEGNVSFREQGAGLDRRAKSRILDAALGPGLSSLDDARFQGAVRFEDSTMAANSAAARYVLDKGTLDLSGDAAQPVPHADTQQIAVDAAKISITLDGPIVSASGPSAVKSVLKHQTDDDKNGKPSEHTPALLKKDQDVFVTAGSLDYDGTTSKANYSGDVRLVQGDTSIKSLTLAIDDKTGDLAATGEAANPVYTSMIREEPDENNKPERLRSDAKANDMKYDDAARKLVYTGAAHMYGPGGDMTADKIELFLTAAGDEVDRVEAYTKITMKEKNGRVTTGDRLTYRSAGEQYVVLGTPVHVTETCGKVTTGKTLTLSKTTDRITVESNDPSRTQTVNPNANCP
ncbi:MAG TPA: LPS export ABC transporter periplasmic protein LptC [Vicinamibacterales bacterium]|jgi:lipopolysaccharide transport protein LptA|nr:LPS export ABC transporter periplasmic protein LptC [Vicinamibacterales bacterium]